MLVSLRTNEPINLILVIGVPETKPAKEEPKKPEQKEKKTEDVPPVKIKKEDDKSSEKKTAAPERKDEKKGTEKTARDSPATANRSQVNVLDLLDC